MTFDTIYGKLRRNRTLANGRIIINTIDITVASGVMMTKLNGVIIRKNGNIAPFEYTESAPFEYIDQFMDFEDFVNAYPECEYVKTGRLHVINEEANHKTEFDVELSQFDIVKSAFWFLKNITLNICPEDNVINNITVTRFNTMVTFAKKCVTRKINLNTCIFDWKTQMHT